MALIYDQTHMRVGFSVTMEYFLDVYQEDVLLLSENIFPLMS